MNDPVFKTINDQIKAEWAAEVTYNNIFPHPYITAFSHEQHMFYWDTYFINKGLIACDQVELAKYNVLNILDVVERFGFMGNAAVTDWGMSRSQPPYLSDMVIDVYHAQPDEAFLMKAYPLLKREYEFWTNTNSNAIENHCTSIAGLQRYSHHASTKQLIALFQEVARRLDLKENISISEQVIIATDLAAEAESGMDFTPRFENHCTQFVPVDLNCLLYRMEVNLGWIRDHLKLHDSTEWLGKAEERKKLINHYCWDDKVGMYFDYNFVSKKRSKVAALSAFQAMWSGICSATQAKKMVQQINLFQTPSGLRTTATIKDNIFLDSGGIDLADRITERSYRVEAKEKVFQWGDHSIWAPLQLIAASGLRRYGYVELARNVANRYMLLIAKNYLQPRSSQANILIKRTGGVLYEKYKVDGTINDDEYRSNPMMGWTAGVYTYLYKLFKDP